jgi:anti-sigma B factor antagonist
VEHQSDVIKVSLSGKFTKHEAFDEVSTQIASFLNKGKRQFIVELNDVNTMNSSGLNLLVRLFTKIRNKGGNLIIVNTSKVVQKLFEISKLDTIFSIFADEKSALNSLNAPEA